MAGALRRVEIVGRGLLDVVVRDDMRGAIAVADGVVGAGDAELARWSRWWEGRREGRLTPLWEVTSPHDLDQLGVAEPAWASPRAGGQAGRRVRRCS
jgi:hypothetical protein